MDDKKALASLFLIVILQATIPSIPGQLGYAGWHRETQHISYTYTLLAPTNISSPGKIRRKVPLPPFGKAD